MLYINTKEQTYKNNYCAETVQFYFKNKVFHQGPVFSKALLQKALDLCQDYESQKIECLLIEYEWGLTIWIEKNREKRSISQIERPKEIRNIPNKKAIVKQNIPRNSNKNRPVVACIDDSKTVQLKVKNTLEKVGYKILNIIDPEDSMITLVRQKPVLILMDINMPQYSGYELCKVLRKSRKLKEIPIVMLTGRTGAIDKIRAKMAGAVNYMTKPFTAEELIGLVQTLAPIKLRNTIEI